ncbi:equilibrative nucleoside transporter, putative [Perkinsus marinus ATCC 50983]|uniref:Equilibrative nucleoside transporter, putative n=2 Tax=Perkinsus marinus (strain ATCC 50983 / TXsc) TaxID=423536 RepID=C5L6F3_PERM5|nr:equilibrative nucleoside transporter, putative [Perkinsus marinus ATCC 50983]EER07614.1 equilibrative nucleoside transporter, putative [Perkinsus marinus ATCC 50983]|eukprot:XP_002775798.1 equilibrative nucleoside transporter, putative [Perkinsus marinus ATCC 50983]
MPSSATEVVELSVHDSNEGLPMDTNRDLEECLQSVTKSGSSTYSSSEKEMDDLKPGECKEEEKESLEDWKLLLMFMILGFIALAPWNFVLTELVYLNDKFEHQFSSNVSIYYGLSVNVAELLLIFIGNKFAFAPRMDFGCILLASFNIALALVAMFIGNDDPLENPGLGFGLGLVCTFMLGFGHSFIESCAFGLAALGSQACMNWGMIGEGVAGLIGWPINILINYILISCGVERYAEWRCFIFFLVTTVLTILCIPMFHYGMMKHPYMKQVMEMEAKRKAGGLKQRQTKRPVYRILMDIAVPAFVVWCALTITFVVFPSQVTQFTSGKGAADNASFIPLLTYMYQIFDTVGRFAPNIGIRLPQWWLVALALSRGIFIPLFICIKLFPWNMAFQHNYFKHIMMAIFAFTNGVTSTLGMMMGPTKVPDDRNEQEIAGYAMSFCLIDGILIGSIFGIWVTDMLPMPPS